jgi:hypothetical protein
MITLPESALKKRDQKIADLTRRNGDLESQIKAITGKAPGLPVCAVPKGFLLRLTVNDDDTITGSKEWGGEADEIALSLPGIPLLSSGRPLTEAAFASATTELRAWGNAQSEPCIFRVHLKRQTRDGDLFEKWFNLVGKAFYWASVR